MKHWRMNLMSHLNKAPEHRVDADAAVRPHIEDGALVLTAHVHVAQASA